MAEWNPIKTNLIDLPNFKTKETSPDHAPKEVKRRKTKKVTKDPKTAQQIVERAISRRKPNHRSNSPRHRHSANIIDIQVNKLTPFMSEMSERSSQSDESQRLNRKQAVSPTVLTAHHEGSQKLPLPKRHETSRSKSSSRQGSLRVREHPVNRGKQFELEKELNLLNNQIL